MMPGAEKATVKREQQAKRKESTDAVRNAGPWTAITGIDAVNVTERAICGSGAVRRPAIAEGLSLAGRRAATVLDPALSGRPAASGPTAWVHHRLRGAAFAPAQGFAVELVAGSVQEAADHCLAAHRIARRLNRPCLCTLDETTAEALELIRLPDAALPEETAGDADEPPPTADPAAVAGEALAAAADQTGRACAPLVATHCDDAEIVLVADGAAADVARHVARQLRADGQRCGWVRIVLRHPFPDLELVELLQGKRAVAVIDSEAGVLTSIVRLALSDGRAPAVHGIPSTKSLPKVIESVRRALELPAAPAPQAAAVEAGQRVVLGVNPRGRWSELLLLGAAARLRELGELYVGRPAGAPRDTVSLIVSDGEIDAEQPVELDALLVADHAVLDEDETLTPLRRGGTVLICAHADSPVTAWHSVPRRQRQRIRERELQVIWVELSEVVAKQPRGEGALRTQLHGALFASLPALGKLVGQDGQVIDALAAQIEAAGRPELDANLLRQGAGAAHEMSTGAVDRGDEEEFRPQSDLPRMPGRPEAEPDDAWSEALRHFYLTTEGVHSVSDTLPAAPLEPATLSLLTGAEREGAAYPIVVGTAATIGGEPIAGSTLGQLLERTIAESKSLRVPILAGHLDRVSRATRRVLASRGGIGPLHDVLEEALNGIEVEFDLSTAATKALKEEIAALERQLPESGELVGLGPSAPLRLYVEAVTAARRSLRETFLNEVNTLSGRLAEMLDIDAGRGEHGPSASSLAGELGSVAESLLDPDAMSNVLPAYRGSRRLGPERRQRIKQALAALRRHLTEAPMLPELVVIGAKARAESWLPARARVIDHVNGPGAAIGLFDGLAQQMVDVLRALRVARLEVQQAYDPTYHDPKLARFGRPGFSSDELLLVPPVVVLETGRRLIEQALASFSTLLRSGRPIHVLVTDSTAAPSRAAMAETLMSSRPGLGYLAVAQREAFVVSATLGRPEHLFAGLTRMATSLSPAAAIVGVPSWEAPVPAWVQLLAACHGRTTPCFVYDPSAGEDWADRFDLSGNPDPELAWSRRSLAYLDQNETEQARDESFTFAHAAALDPAYRALFRVIPVEAWNDEQTELAELLAEGGDAPRLPFIWVRNSDGTLARAVLTAELMFACRDRTRAWHILQELAGVDNAHVRHAVDEARTATLAEAEQQRQDCSSWTARRWPPP